MDHYPEMLDQLDDEIARRILDTLSAAAESGALPGFEGDPRGKGVVWAWRRRRFPNRCGQLRLLPSKP